jgi:hypothetical protein
MPLGSGLTGGGNNPEPFVLTIHNGNLIAGGNFTFAGGAGASRIAQWNGTIWQPMGSGMTPNHPFTSVGAMTSYDGDLVAGGNFTIAGEQVSAYLARWHDCPPCPADITGDVQIGVGDLLAVINGWGPCPAPPLTCPANIVNAGASIDRVDINDLMAVINAWGPCP